MDSIAFRENGIATVSREFLINKAAATYTSIVRIFVRKHTGFKDQRKEHRIALS